MTTLQKKQKIGTKLGTENKKGYRKKAIFQFLPIFSPYFPLFGIYFVPLLSLIISTFPLFTSFFAIFEKESEKNALLHTKRAICIKDRKWIPN